ncbi:MAG: heme ABC exporter ATP-binding protein CcmA [Gammaproteobacteria bacterium]|nr:heme ABC exporter ATP-binding protein CcmA [Gammaproteobacteria bacterium]
MVCALGMAERGEVLWNGTPIGELGEEYRAALSYVGHLNGIKGELTALENLEAARALAPTRNDAAALDVLAEAGLAGYEEIPCRYLSAGQKRRVSIARLLLSACPLWVLDEPATALDSKGVEAFQRLVERHAASGGMVLVTSHRALAFGAASTRTLEL